MTKPIVSIVMGSQSDLETVNETIAVLKDFGVPFEAKVLSAHRTPKELEEYVTAAVANGVKVFIAAAGGAAALAGVIASHTCAPVIGIPMHTSSLNGLDSLLSTVQMPAGVPVACMAIGKAGAKNAGLFAAQLVGMTDETICGKLSRYRSEMRKKVVDTVLKI